MAGKQATRRQARAAAASEDRAVARAQMPTPIGVLTIVASDQGLRSVDFPRASGPSVAKNASANAQARGVLEQAIRELEEFFAGERREFSVPLELGGTEFQMAVWRELARIPFGETRTYGEVARAIGRPGAFRAVGGAAHNNPIAIIIPCHRMVGANGSLVGFGGGLDLKQKLLDWEAGRLTLGCKEH